MQEVVAHDEHAAVRHEVGAGVRQAEPAVHVQQEGQQLRGGIEGGVEGAPVPVELDAFLDEPVEPFGAGQEGGPVGPSGGEHLPVLAPHAAVEAAGELERLGQLRAALSRFDEAQPEGEPAAGQQRHAAAPGVQQVDLGADLAAGGGAHLDEAFGAHRVGDQLEQRRVGRVLLDAGDGLVLLARDEAGLALGGPLAEHVPDVPAAVGDEVVELLLGQRLCGKAVGPQVGDAAAQQGAHLCVAGRAGLVDGPVALQERGERGGVVAHGVVSVRISRR